MPRHLDHLPAATPDDLAEVLDRLAGLGIALAARIARNGLSEDLGAADGGVNASGDRQTALDLIADGMAQVVLAGSAVRFFASEEQAKLVEINPDGTLALVIDPLDGALNIDGNAPLGTIFGIYPAEATGDASVLRPARELLASGYVIYGPQCGMMLRIGDGKTRKYVLDSGTEQFRDLGSLPDMPLEMPEYAINAANYRHWPAPIRSFIDDRLAGNEGPLGHDFNMRWIAALVAETHRILTRGGIYLYPGDSRKGYEAGRLRLVYECGPIAHLVEGAGGRASDGVRPILDLVPTALHQRTPFVFGSANQVARVATHHDLPEDESALFGRRGLFR
ncbi:class 1 fructose-bisphosphatase [uncultured Paracoccus sp.]|uniref:class 1 fructose-bisphosphatase n=1 Tax=uncultured Paracoccus sp. TaxID=189685 RepID=UPI00260EFED4|nr:class 1 fructose-bisphosphatase [uncultured Paracoccus sp.]